MTTLLKFESEGLNGYGITDILMMYLHLEVNVWVHYTSPETTTCEVPSNGVVEKSLLPLYW